MAISSKLFRAKLLALVLMASACNSDDSSSAKGQDDILDAENKFSKDIVIPPMKCERQKSGLEFVNGVSQILNGRDANSAERARAKDTSFDREAFVDEIIASDEANVGFERFLSGLLGLGNIVVRTDGSDEERVADAQLVSDLVKEPSVLYLRNKEKPWSWFFSTREIYCTKATGDLYGRRVFDSNFFVPCTLPEDRAGFLGLASFLRATPSNFVMSNNNYKRVKVALYLSQGILLNEATNGPTGDVNAGPGIPYPDCAPNTDMRQDVNGQTFGTGAISLQGPTCASCHSTHNGPLSVAFRHFDEKGGTYTYESIAAINDKNGSNTDFLTALVNEDESCWSYDSASPPRSFRGVPGLARLITESDTLGHALGVQIPRHLANIPADANMRASIAKAYYEGDGTLTSAVRGFLLSDSYSCAQKGN